MNVEFNPKGSFSGTMVTINYNHPSFKDLVTQAVDLQRNEEIERVVINAQGINVIIRYVQEQKA